CQSCGQTGDIDQRVDFMPPQIPQGARQDVSEHVPFLVAGFRINGLKQCLELIRPEFPYRSALNTACYAVTTIIIPALCPEFKSFSSFPRSARNSKASPRSHALRGNAYGKYRNFNGLCIPTRSVGTSQSD